MYWQAGLGQPANTGMAPLVLDTKIHLWGADDVASTVTPAVGIEFYVQTDWASPSLQVGTQPGAMLLFSNELPWDVKLEWNIGLGVTTNASGGNDLPRYLSVCVHKISDSRSGYFPAGLCESSRVAPLRTKHGAGRWIYSLLWRSHLSVRQLQRSHRHSRPRIGRKARRRSSILRTRHGFPLIGRRVATAAAIEVDCRLIYATGH